MAAFYIIDFHLIFFDSKFSVCVDVYVFFSSSHVVLWSLCTVCVRVWYYLSLARQCLLYGNPCLLNEKFSATVLSARDNRTTNPSIKTKYTNNSLTYSFNHCGYVASNENTSFARFTIYVCMSVSKTLDKICFISTHKAACDNSCRVWFYRICLLQRES